MIVLFMPCTATCIISAGGAAMIDAAHTIPSVVTFYMSAVAVRER